jgi:regulator of replication initiation timing
MYNNLEDLPPEYEKDLSILENQITELFTLLEKKEMQVSQLKDENAELRTRIQNLQQQLSPPKQQLNPPQQQLSPPQQQLSPPQQTNQPIDTIRVPNQQIHLATSPSTSVSTNKRKCPKCGAMGFAIKEVNDKSRLISYVPRRIYAKKRVCTKCRYEF